jgi:uracil phosphoribosyltransferase
VSILKDWGLVNIKFCAVVASKTGLDALVAAHPDVEVFVCAVDEILNEGKYVVPGLGDAGDRIFATDH